MPRRASRGPPRLGALFGPSTTAAAAAIDDAGRKDAAFDAEVQAFQALGERLRRLTSAP